ncbi:L,D-transpeptidase [Bacillus carboniphilus]|uniref:L,D-transpeptidase n=1 Tax=Bacillus carboniphilus TaxID=86663 RepID=A0ABY9K1Q8_9BACI|nr:L,D-transpeptidase [Bacillus carboniphilus]WLR43861.1 L,D-transpeptidase [Bacillus carboniphilus]
MKLILVTFLLVASPIWPLGQNPLPGDPFIIVNLQKNQLALIRDNSIYKVYPIATGKIKDPTPEGVHTVTVKAINPYYRRNNIQGGDPKNPLGSRWIGFDALDTDGRIYGIHGTNNPWSIGYSVSNGCVRMLNKSVEEIFDYIPIGTKVYVTTSSRSFEEIAVEQGAMKRNENGLKYP